MRARLRPANMLTRLSHARRLADDRSGVAMLEFAFTMPIVLGIGMYAAETANLALTHLRVSQVGLSLADNASRVGSMNANNREELREIDVNDVLTAAKLQGKKLNLTSKGRITLSSLEEHGGKQMIHWQRCIGLKSGAGWDSSYGTTKITDGTDTSPSNAGTDVTPGKGKAGGMGKAGEEVFAPQASGVMFVEVNYEYQPLVGITWLPGAATRIHYVQAYIVRDRRLFDQIYNPDGAERMTCDKYSA